MVVSRSAEHCHWDKQIIFSVLDIIWDQCRRKCSANPRHDKKGKIPSLNCILRSIERSLAAPLIPKCFQRGEISTSRDMC